MKPIQGVFGVLFSFSFFVLRPECVCGEDVTLKSPEYRRSKLNVLQTPFHSAEKSGVGSRIPTRTSRALKWLCDIRIDSTKPLIAISL